MRKAGFVMLGAGSLFAVLAACVGGPGPLPDQGPDQASQGGGVQGGGQSGAATGSGNAGSAGNGNQGSGGTSTGGATRPPNTKTVAAKDFDRSCTADSDCVAVAEGLVCSPCKCPNAAIARKDQAKFLAEVAKESSDCPETGDVACEACPALAVGCDPETNECAPGKSTKTDGG